MSPTAPPVITAVSVVGGAGISPVAELSVAAETKFATVVVDEVAIGVATTTAEEAIGVEKDCV
jgi:hypothetical protein